MIKLKYKPLAETYVTSGFGVRELLGFEFHPGIDYKAAVNAPIYAVDDGKVVVSANDINGYGLYVVLQHSNYCTLYAHLKALNLPVGHTVKAGDLIGNVGMTGATTGAHLHFEIRDCLYDDRFWVKGNLKGRHAMCIDPVDFVAKAKVVNMIKTEFTRYRNMTELKGDPIKLQNDIVDKRIWNITEFTDCVNGTFYWYNADGTTYATSILVIDGKIYRNEANHYYNFGCPQNVFIVYNNGKVEMKKVYFANQLDYKNIKMAVGGVGLRDITNPNFKYDPASEGFKKDKNRITGKTEDQSGVLRTTNKTVIGYSYKTGKAYLLTAKNIHHNDLIKTISIGESYDIALSLDGGGSTFMDAEGNYVLHGTNNRRINNTVRFVP